MVHLGHTVCLMASPLASLPGPSSNVRLYVHCKGTGETVHDSDRGLESGFIKYSHELFTRGVTTHRKDTVGVDSPDTITAKALGPNRSLAFGMYSLVSAGGDLPWPLSVSLSGALSCAR